MPTSTPPARPAASTYSTLHEPFGPDAVGPFAPGTTGVLRGIRYVPGRGNVVSFAVGGTVLEDSSADDELSVFATVPGSGRATRAGQGAGPNARLVPNADWDGTHHVAEWEGTTVVRVHRRGEPWSIWRWHDGTDWTEDWYGNIEAPWHRTPLGFDMQDYDLDVVGRGRPGSENWQVAFKDEDELAWTRDIGQISQADVDRVTGIGRELFDVFRTGGGVIGEDWDRWLPREDWAPVPLPDGWEHVGI
jgi:hypothetical protein